MLAKFYQTEKQMLLNIELGKFLYIQRDLLENISAEFFYWSKNILVVIISFQHKH